jgi:hypothetical protein
MKRIILACFVLSLFFFNNFVVSALAKDEGGMSMSGCEERCANCQTMCEKTSEYVKKLGGKAASPERIKLLADCISICKTSHDFLSRGSQFHPDVCKVCADVCTACAKSCQELNDPKLKDCIAECKKCAASCHKMAG